jgi:probable rRNA maturation factor
MTVLVSCELGRAAPVARRLRSRGQAYLEALGRPDAELSILVTGDAGIRRLNRAWRGKDRATDVLSFPLSDPPGVGRLLGDVVISIDTAARRGGRDARAVRFELDRYLAHGLLHLLGFDHGLRADAEVMAAREEALVRGEGLVGSALRAKRRVRQGATPRRRKKG